MSSRDEILGRIRAARGPHALEYDAIPRLYRRDGELSTDARLELFADRLRDYGCGVHICAENEIANQIASVLAGRNKTHVIATPDIARAWLPREFPSGAGASYRELDRAEGVITRCALAIASTGTIVLRHDESTPRALTLIPDYHLCIVKEEQIVELVPEAIRRMSAFATAPITTISGPSATSDIEMTRIQGVHGPRTLDVLIVR